jgi:hypothetical protein
MDAPSWPYDLGYVLPRSDWTCAGNPPDRVVVTHSRREQEAFRQLTAELAD